jgi:hypothetical protein
MLERQYSAGCSYSDKSPPLVLRESPDGEAGLLNEFTARSQTLLLQFRSERLVGPVTGICGAIEENPFPNCRNSNRHLPPECFITLKQIGSKVIKALTFAVNEGDGAGRDTQGYFH